MEIIHICSEFEKIYKINLHNDEHLAELENIELEDVFLSDAPDFVDAYFSKAQWGCPDCGKIINLKEEELSELDANFDFKWQHIQKRLY